MASSVGQHCEFHWLIWRFLCTHQRTKIKKLYASHFLEENHQILISFIKEAVLKYLNRWLSFPAENSNAQKGIF